MSRVLFWAAVVPLFLVVIVFAVNNHETVALSLWPAVMNPVPFPVYGVALCALFLGFVWGGLVSWYQNGSTRHRMRVLQRQSETEQRELMSLRDRLERLQTTERQATIPPTPVPLAPVSATSAAAAVTAPTHAGSTVAKDPKAPAQTAAAER